MSPYVTPIWCHNVMKRCCLYEPIYWSAPLVLPDPCKPRMFHNLADIFFRWCLGHTCASHLLAWSPTNQLASFHACIHTYIIIHTYIRTYVRTYIHIYIYIYICVCVIIYTQVFDYGLSMVLLPREKHAYHLWVSIWYVMIIISYEKFRNKSSD